MRKYLKTFKWKGGDFNDKARVVLFTISTLLFGGLALITMKLNYDTHPEYNPIFGDNVFILSVSLLFGLLFTYLTDLSHGILRYSPLDKYFDRKADEKFVSKLQTKKNIVIACDHGGFEMKEEIVKLMKDNNICDVTDYGCNSNDSVDYPDFAHKLATDVENGKYDLGILICGSGNGINMTANSHKGIRSALCWTPNIAKLAREHNDANVMALPGRFISSQKGWSCVKMFLTTEFEGGRHQKRVNKIK
ncbi:MAG: Putative sugar phosphate isomerase YwlF [uncultured marine phage]|uniref:Sugar phosphate isomerase YwlF n=1 Tax=uncultured marine phage TaxID=707152 RepID=A0A8D9CB93_9VIRU|nr:MAG: Putative sugar phosphate isomerase YwlF [uncultured marine phage]